MFGVRRFFADIDNRREYTYGGIIGSALRFVSGEGFGDVFDEADMKHRTAAEFRERHILESLRALK